MILNYLQCSWKVAMLSISERYVERNYYKCKCDFRSRRLSVVPLSYLCSLSQCEVGLLADPQLVFSPTSGLLQGQPSLLWMLAHHSPPAREAWRSWQGTLASSGGIFQMLMMHILHPGKKTWAYPDLAPMLFSLNVFYFILFFVYVF